MGEKITPGISLLGCCEWIIDYVGQYRGGVLALRLHEAAMLLVLPPLLPSCLRYNKNRSK
jgi:hypothetical protein